jgi:hypothetical protein
MTHRQRISARNLFGYVEVNDIEALHDEIVDRGAISTAPVNMPLRHAKDRRHHRRRPERPLLSKNLSG